MSRCFSLWVKSFLFPHLQEGAAAEDDARPRHESMQQVKFLPCQVHDMAPHEGDSPFEIELHVRR